MQDILLSMKRLILRLMKQIILQIIQRFGKKHMSKLMKVGLKVQEHTLLTILRYGLSHTLQIMLVLVVRTLRIMIKTIQLYIQ